VRSFDLEDGDDLRDPDAVRDAVAGCAAVVHAGAIPHDSSGSAADIAATNVLGTWHVLLGAEHHRVERVVAFSSIQVFGCTEGDGEPAYVPLDDDHPLRAARPYGMSKRLVEEMCEIWTSRTRIPTIVLRPAATIDEERWQRLDPADFDLGAYVHVDDVATAVVHSVRVPVSGHVRLLLAGAGEVDTRRARDVLGWNPAPRRVPRRPFRRLRRR
jgi:nucleoside-diphosphate-sugar epimerase